MENRYRNMLIIIIPYCTDSGGLEGWWYGHGIFHTVQIVMD